MFDSIDGLLRWDTFSEELQPWCTKFVFIFTLTLAAWTHPQLYNCRLATLLRMPLTLISVIWWSFYPFLFAIKPLGVNLAANSGIYLKCFVLATKCLDWGFFSGPQSRRSWVRDPTKHNSGYWESAEKDAEVERTLISILGHIFFQLTCLRGLQYPWGRFSQINQNTWKMDVSRLIVFHCSSLVILGGFLYAQSLPPSAISQTLVSMGLPIFITSPVTRCIENVFLIICVFTSLEALNSWLVTIAHLLHPVLFSMKFPQAVVEFFDPIYYPALFGNFSEVKSISEFWGKVWHQAFRRSFLVLGTYPLMRVARLIGQNRDLHKVLGIVGAFLASGVFHAGPFFLISDLRTKTGSVSQKDKLSAVTCFGLQAIGILMEPYVLGRIITKKRFGENSSRLWTYSFLILTLSFFAIPACKTGRFFSIYKPVENWNIFDLIVPVAIAPMFHRLPCQKVTS